MKFLLTIFLVLAVTFAQDLNCDLEQYYLADPMNVQGQAFVSLQPELAVINFTVETLEEEASESLQKNSKIVKNTIDSILELGVQEDEITTTSLSINPQYDYRYNQSTQQSIKIFLGYRVENSIIIRTKQMDKTGKIIDSAVRSGVQNVNSVEFDATSSTKKEAKDKLIAEAVKDAKSRAELALTALNHSIIGVKNISIDSYGSVMYANRNQFDYAEVDYDMGSSENGPQIYSQDIKLSATVNVSFLIDTN